MCAEIGVLMHPAYAAGAILAPIYAWYHASWDTEPDIVGWEGMPAGEMTLMDYHLCTWPPPLSKSDDSIARRLIEDGVPVAPLPFTPRRKSN